MGETGWFYGSRSVPAPLNLTPMMERGLFWSRVRVGAASECWPWTGSGALPQGYISLRFEGRKTYAHRVAYELSVGPIQEGMEIDHVRDRGCTVRSCCNPSHLEAVTHVENMKRGRRPNQTHCMRGHALSGNNLYVYRESATRVHRQCRTCRAARRAHLP